MTEQLPKEDCVTRYDLLHRECADGEFVVYAAYQAACVERDMYKAQAEINADTIKNMNDARRERLRSLIPETSHE